jgi:hypothetical protein
MKEEKLNKDTVFLALSSLQDVGDGKADYNFDAERAREFFDELKETYEDAKNPDLVIKFKKIDKYTKYSNCCGALMESPWDDIEMCPDCKEHCGVEEVIDNPPLKVK